MKPTTKKSTPKTPSAPNVQVHRGPPPPLPPEDPAMLRREQLDALRYPHSQYEIHVEWSYIEERIQKEAAEVCLDINPDFQRSHKWTPAQQVAYVEHILCGGETGKVLIFGHTGENVHCYKYRPDGGLYLPNYALVDGKQRLQAVRLFLKDGFRVFAGVVAAKPEGYLWSECSRSIQRAIETAFLWRIVVVPTRADLLKLYLKFNAGGTPHTAEDLSPVEALLAAELAHPTDHVVPEPKVPDAP